MLMNIVNLLVNHLLGKTSAAEATPGIFSMFTRANIRKFAMICAGLSFAMILFFGGFFTVLLDLVLTSREQQQLLLSQASIVGFSLIGVSALCMLALFSRKSWRMPQTQMRAEPAAPSPVQEAMADLIRDFVDERRLAREMMLQQYAAEAAAAAAMDPGFDPATMSGVDRGDSRTTGPVAYN